MAVSLPPASVLTVPRVPRVSTAWLSALQVLVPADCAVLCSGTGSVAVATAARRDKVAGVIVGDVLVQVVSDQAGCGEPEEVSSAPVAGGSVGEGGEQQKAMHQHGAALHCQRVTRLVGDPVALAGVRTGHVANVAVSCSTGGA